MTDSRVASLAALLHELVERQQGEHLEPAQPDEQGRCTVCLKRAEWLIARGVTVSETPEGPWIAFHALHGRWYVELEDGDYGSRERLGPFSELEAIAVRDALNLVRQTTQNDR